MEQMEDYLLANDVTALETNLRETCDQSATDNNVGCKWSSVEERLPDVDVEVLTMRATGMSIESQCGNGRWFFDEYNGEHGVTHWMPMPEPPKGE